VLGSVSVNLFPQQAHGISSAQSTAWNESILDTTIFRQSMAGLYGVEISPTEALRGNALRPWVRKVNEERGFEQFVGPYVLRRATSTELDSGGDSLPSIHETTKTDYNLSIDTISGPLRSLNCSTPILERFRNDTSRDTSPPMPRLFTDAWQLQEAVMRATADMSCTIDPRRPRKLTDAQSASVELHPLVRQLRRRRDQLKASICRRGTSITSQRGTDIYKRYKNAVQEYREGKRR
jgi:Protein of unknown function (DUF3435)